ncbi:cysteine hydrolase family protein [Bordetella bronchialis]|uniref:Chloramphenicol resistance protein n=1 Tax=Bordetella bronchialis TaxID=463025 RepID=A0A193FNL3_9BORD|nr:cysteine hydrolase [Bordetella bronchialis]ANN68689.1 chloramphenicol resistance protein [Bordetella bronchialis]ANN73832.1 chloramphenicol resistance protein [Bordetella bronchialis]
MGKATSLFLVLDMQNDLVHPDGPAGNTPLGAQVRERQLIAKTAAAIAKARAAGVAVGFVRVGFSEGYPECPPASPVFAAAAQHGLFKLGAWGTEIHPDLEQRPGDVQVVKHRVSPFYSTTLEVQLRARNVQRIYCSGVSTQAVVQATVRDGHDRDYEMIVLEDLCAAHSAQEHENSIGSIGRFCRIESSDTVVFAQPG